MADLSDIENELLQVILPTVYPNGTSQPSIAAVDVRIYRGWPISAQLDTDLAAGKCHVSVYSQPNVARNTTRYPREDQELTAPVHTISATVTGNQISIGGTVSTPQNVLVLCGRNNLFSYQVKAADTLASIAAALAALIAVQFSGTAAADDVITVAGKPGIIMARVAGQGQVWTEQRRQERGVQITCWCPTPVLRDVLGPAIDAAFAQIDFFTAPTDQSACRIRYESDKESDEGEKVQIFRRDFFYSVEYPTTTVTEAFEVGAISVGTQADGETTTINY